MESSFVTDVYAKVNLALEVGFSESGSLHPIRSVICPFTALFDRLTATPRKDNAVTVTYADGRVYPRDNALKAAEYLVKEYSLKGADIVIEKGIPEGIGIGGSSADAAGVARCLKALNGAEFDLDKLCGIGSDVPAQYVGQSVMVSGAGEILTSVKLPNLYLTLVYGEVKLDTAKVFKAYDVLGGAGGNAEEFLKDLRPFNSLEAAAVAIRPEILIARKVLTAVGFERVVMTGSGSGYVGIALSEEENGNLYGKAAELARRSNLKILNTAILN